MRTPYFLTISCCSANSTGWYESCSHERVNIFGIESRQEASKMTAQQTFRNTLIIIATLAAAYALYTSARILIVLLVAIIVASAVRSSVLWLKNNGVPQGLAIILVYALIAVVIFLLAVVVLPPAISQF